EQFVDNRMHWPDDANSTAWLGNPGYRLQPRQPGAFVAIAAPIPFTFSDVVVTANFQKLGGPMGGGYGLIVGDQHSSAGDGLAQYGRYIVLEAGDRGEIGVWRREEKSWVDLLSWTPSAAVRTGDAPNRLEVWVTGDRLT